MSSGKTETLGLNQWKLTDAFLMEEMNTDNRKIDAAVKNLNMQQMRLVDLKYVGTTTGDVNQIDIDMSDINFSKWQYIILDVYVTNRCNILMNGSTSACDYWGYGNSQPISGACGYLNSGDTRLIFPMHGKGGGFRFIASGNHTFYCGQSNYYGFSELKTMNFVTQGSSDKFAAGSTFSFKGVQL